MNCPDETRIESLLNQIRLAEPSRQLDESIASLAENRILTARPTRRKFSWTALASTALAASLFGLMAGIMSSGEKLDGASIASNSLRNVSATQMFHAMHGHSGNAQFHDCSTCHAFKSKHEQTVTKWLVDDWEPDDHQSLPRCSMCHLQNEQMIATELGAKG